MTELKRKPHLIPLETDLQQAHEVTSSNSPLQYLSARVLEMQAGATFCEVLQELESCLVILTGQVDVVTKEEVFRGIGTRASVFDKVPTDSVYVGKEETYTIQAITETKIMICYGKSTKKLPNTLIRAAQVEVEHRGILNNKRTVHNILTDSSEIAENLLVVEVYTAGGNWSSYPPHKHDQDNLPNESLLEELYYHEMNPKQGFVFQRVYTDDRLIDETMTVETGEIVLVPKGYHPVAVPDGYESYYLNIMAGPKKVWQFYNDPAHEWILNRKSE
ncbi:5-deoxy-glucuronate isomerase [Enterococcus sp. AZ194]